ncbi:metallophosphoesterase family protein [Bifidobacterium gallicum]|uniref:Nuclease SbcCD subunit D n=1 Tax=Bifidobacterium gallicum DSM 20093 = LMG 11596 TaxID=561180 RepID=D1NTD7_9BIFI|nr:exonuclease SbcCD subunit D [Bifidobacterium gallicum]EFA22991.1 exonuclease SbcCD, D subunit [Bifidobacterium gallicum DSM 20093 = LMG 11596]KFI57691.1 putative nuclease SbcCD, D subunit [Bifidobacterium gallicum DSM 20093 = LMG 11596]
MRMLHTSDWHIGRRFKGMDLLDYQTRVLDWLIDTIECEHVDVLCVSGDIYDLPRPGADAVRVFDQAYERLGALQVNGHALHVVMTPGNHDSAARLGVGSRLLRENVHMRCDLAYIGEPVDIAVGGQRLLIYALPYLNPDASRGMLAKLAGHDVACSHAAVMQAALELVHADLERRREQDHDVPAVLMAHTFVSGAEQSDSERGIAVGGIDSVPASMFSTSGLDYLALGHLHRPQRVTIPVTGDAMHTPIARYSGSLLAYSFSERTVPPRLGNGKQVVIVDFEHATGNVPHNTDVLEDAEDRNEPPVAARVRRVRTLDVQSDEPALVQVSGTPDELIDVLAPLHHDDWVSMQIMLDGPMPRGLYQRLSAAYAYALEKRTQYVGAMARRPRTMADLSTAPDELSVLSGFVQYSYGRPPEPEELAVLKEAVTRVHAARDEHAS